MIQIFKNILNVRKYQQEWSTKDEAKSFLENKKIYCYSST